MIKALIFDIDGVLILHKEWYPASLSNKKYNNPVAILSEFADGPLNQECDRGILDPLEAIKPFLKEMKWEYDSKDFFDKQYEFESQYIDFEVLSMIKELRQQSLEFYIGSNQNYYRKNFLIDRMKLNEIFDELFFSCDLGCIKPETEYWTSIMKQMNHNNSGINAGEVLFLDDMIENIESAKRYGMKARQIKTRDDVIEVINKFKSITTIST
jgi:putative hydrolase of the HAD superfamily